MTEQDSDDVPTLGRKRRAKRTRTIRYAQDINRLKSFSPRAKMRRAGRRRR